MTSIISVRPQTLVSTDENGHIIDREPDKIVITCIEGVKHSYVYEDADARNVELESIITLISNS